MQSSWCYRGFLKNILSVPDFSSNLVFGCDPCPKNIGYCHMALLQSDNIHVTQKLMCHETQELELVPSEGYEIMNEKYGN